MDINMILKIAGIGIIVSVLNQVLIRSGREEMAMMTTLTGLVIVLFMVIDMINKLFQNVKNVFQFQ
jgi:stage III sporulation protein AC